MAATCEVFAIVLEVHDNSDYEQDAIDIEYQPMRHTDGVPHPDDFGAFATRAAAEWSYHSAVLYRPRNDHEDLGWHPNIQKLGRPHESANTLVWNLHPYNMATGRLMSETRLKKLDPKLSAVARIWTQQKQFKQQRSLQL